VKTEHGGKDMMSLSRCVAHCKRDIYPNETASEWHIPFYHTTKPTYAGEIGRCDLALSGPFGIAEISRRSFLPVEDNDKESFSTEHLHVNRIHSNLANGQSDTAVPEEPSKAIPFNVSRLPRSPTPT